jgi:hypothetical protein
MRQCWADSGGPWSQPLQVAGIPIVWSQVLTGNPLLRVSEVRAPTLRGRALCHILAMIWATVEFRRLRDWTKEMMLGVCCLLFALRSICGGFWKEVSQVLISFCLAESFPSLLTLRETIVRGRSDIRSGA